LSSYLSLHSRMAAPLIIAVTRAAWVAKANVGNAFHKSGPLKGFRGPLVRLPQPASMRSIHYPQLLMDLRIVEVVKLRQGIFVTIWRRIRRKVIVIAPSDQKSSAAVCTAKKALSLSISSAGGATQRTRATQSSKRSYPPSLGESTWSVHVRAGYRPLTTG
jgi:hypothetical protein